MKTWKIYKHTLLVGEHAGWSYIGQTSADNPNKRWANGIGYSKRNAVFYNAIQKYGWDNFSHEIIEDGIETLELANTREMYWIAYYHTWIKDPLNKGYNTTPGGSGRAHAQSEEAKQKISKALKGRVFTLEHKAKMNAKLKRKAIICIETNVCYCSISEAARQTGISRENIKTAVNGKRLSAGGYHWALVGDKQTQDDLKKLNGKCKLAKAKVVCLATGEIYESIREAARQKNVCQAAISNAIKRGTRCCKSFWKYL